MHNTHQNEVSISLSSGTMRNSNHLGMSNKPWVSAYAFSGLNLSRVAQPGARTGTAFPVKRRQTRQKKPEPEPAPPEPLSTRMVFADAMSAAEFLDDHEDSLEAVCAVCKQTRTAGVVDYLRSRYTRSLREMQYAWDLGLSVARTWDVKRAFCGKKLRADPTAFECAALKNAQSAEELEMLLSTVREDRKPRIVEHDVLGFFASSPDETEVLLDVNVVRASLDPEKSVVRREEPAPKSARVLKRKRRVRKRRAKREVL